MIIFSSLSSCVANVSTQARDDDDDAIGPVKSKEDVGEGTSGSAAAVPKPGMLSLCLSFFNCCFDIELCPFCKSALSFRAIRVFDYVPLNVLSYYTRVFFRFYLN